MQTINVVGYGPLNFPDDMSQEDMQSAIHAGIASGKLKPVAQSATQEVTPLKKPESVPLTKEQKLKKFADLAGVNSTPFDTIKNIAVGLGNAGQNLAQFAKPVTEPLANVIRPYIPNSLKVLPETVNMENTFGVNDQNRNNLVQGLAQYSPMLLTGGMSLPAEIAANTIYGATQSPEHPIIGGGLTGGTTAALGLLNNMGPIPRAIARSLASAGLGYAVGGKEGAELGATAGLFAPTIAGRLGIGKTIGNDIVGMLNKEDLPIVQQRLQAANAEGQVLTPGEASGRPDIRAREIRLGKFGEGATEAFNINKNRMASQKSAIAQLKNEISPSGTDPAFEIRKAAQDSIKELEDTRSAATSPYYKAAENEEIPQQEFDKLLEIPRIKDTMHEVLNDKDIAPTLGGQQPTGKKMMAMVENRIDNLITKAKSKPYNQDRIQQLQYARDNVATDYGDPKVQSVLKEIYNDDPVFQATAMGINARSMKFLDAVKQRINTASKAEASGLNPTGQDKRKAGLIQGAANKITDITDQYSKNYQIARSIHEQMSPVVDTAKNGVLGRIANLSDTQLKTASSMIFDPAQTDIRVLARIKQNIMRRNPNAWNGIVRNEIERLNKKGTIDGVSFYQKIFSDENKYQQFKLALDHNPNALQSFENLKTSWEDLSRSSTKATTSGEREKLGMNGFRDAAISILEMIADQITGTKQKEALKYLYSPSWEADYMNIVNTKNSPSKVNQMAKMFAKILPPIYLVPKSENK